MKKLVGLISLLSVFFSGFSQTVSTERQQIENTIQLYFEGWATGDTAKLGKAMHATCHLKLYREGKLTDFSKSQYLSGFKPRAWDKNMSFHLVALDVTNNMGSAKVEIRTQREVFTDYFNLMKTNEGWVIADKVSTRTPISVTTPDR